MWQSLRKNLFGRIYFAPGIWNIPASGIILHGLLGYCIWAGLIQWPVGLLVFVYLHETRLVYATKKARRVFEAQRAAYQQAYNQQEIEAGRLIAPDGKEYL